MGGLDTVDKTVYKGDMNTTTTTPKRKNVKKEDFWRTMQDKVDAYQSGQDDIAQMIAWVRSDDDPVVEC